MTVGRAIDHAELEWVLDPSAIARPMADAGMRRGMMIILREAEGDELDD